MRDPLLSSKENGVDISNTKTYTVICRLRHITRGQLQRMRKGEIDDSKKFNIYVFGMQGSGKSSFINSLYTFVSDKVVNDIVTVSGTDNEHVTTQLRFCNFEKGTGLEDLRIWDMVGLTEETYQADEIDKIIDGMRAPDWKMMTRVTMEEEESLEKNAHKRIPNIILVLVALGDCADKVSDFGLNVFISSINFFFFFRFSFHMDVYNMCTICNHVFNFHIFFIRRAASTFFYLIHEIQQNLGWCY